jgi:DNA-binding MarR family transcriptional regulator
MVNMAAPIPASPTASPLFLREPEIRRGIELLYFGYANLTRSIDAGLAKQGLGRAHHRALYFIARKPDLTVSELLGILGITKQSLGRVLGELAERGMVETRTGDRDRRQRLLRLTAAGTALEAELRALAAPPQATLKPSLFMVSVSALFFSSESWARSIGKRCISSSCMCSSMSERNWRTLAIQSGEALGMFSSS